MSLVVKLEFFKQNFWIHAIPIGEKEVIKRKNLTKNY